MREAICRLASKIGVLILLFILFTGAIRTDAAGDSRILTFPVSEIPVGVLSIVTREAKPNIFSGVAIHEVRKIGLASGAVKVPNNCMIRLKVGEAYEGGFDAKRLWGY